jgi:hypothetical protein
MSASTSPVVGSGPLSSLSNELSLARRAIHMSLARCASVSVDLRPPFPLDNVIVGVLVCVKNGRNKDGDGC